MKRKHLIYNNKTINTMDGIRTWISLMKYVNKKVVIFVVVFCHDLAKH